MNHDDMESSDTLTVQSEHTSSSSTLSISPRFCAQDSDVTLQSSDGMFFKVHRKNLAVCSGVFAGAEDITPPSQGEIVHMSEHSTVLDLLLQFMYPQPQPELSQVDFEILAPLAEAAEKFEVFPAMVVCRIQMQAAIPLHMPEVLNYSGRHNYPDILDEVAQHTIGMPIKDIVAALSPEVLAAWLQYHQGWMDVLSFATTTMNGYGHQRHTSNTHPLPGVQLPISAQQVQTYLAGLHNNNNNNNGHMPIQMLNNPLPGGVPPPAIQPPLNLPTNLMNAFQAHQAQAQANAHTLAQSPSPSTHNPCNQWSALYSSIVHRMAGKPSSLKSLDVIFGPAERDDLGLGGPHSANMFQQRRCDLCKRDIVEWRRRVEEQIAQLPRLSTFLRM